MNSSNRPLAITDIETTGAISSVHEIIEIGLVLVNQETLEIEDTFNVKIIPKHIENAQPEAFARNGYTPEAWKDAISLAEAMRIYGEKTKEGLFCAYNVSFDWPFIDRAFYTTGVTNPMSTVPNHDRLDILTMAWMKGLRGKPNLSLKSACELFGVPPEPFPHTALDGAMAAYEVYKKLMK